MLWMSMLDVMKGQFEDNESVWQCCKKLPVSGDTDSILSLHLYISNQKPVMKQQLFLLLLAITATGTLHARQPTTERPVKKQVIRQFPPPPAQKPGTPPPPSSGPAPAAVPAPAPAHHKKRIRYRPPMRRSTNSLLPKW